VLDENEFLSPHGLRSLSRIHKDRPYSLRIDGEEFTAAYEPAESRNRVFGGNSNWRGPVWFPLNHLFVEALERYHYYYGDTLKVECPTGSGQLMDLHAVAHFLRTRLSALFLPDAQGPAPVPRRGPLLRRRPELEGPGALPRVLPRRHRPGTRRQPPDRMDGAHRADAREPRPSACR
jgi:hypothetical protein